MLKQLRIRQAAQTLAVLAGLMAVSSSSRADLLVNGDFEAAPILSAGQSDVPNGWRKLISTDPAQVLYDESISGISGWTYATPYENGTLSDHGLARQNAAFGRPDDRQSLFINNWNRLVSQSVDATFQAGDILEASVDFGTLGDDTDAGRAGRFYLVAGEADPADLDNFSARSIILGELSVANPTWSEFTPDVLVGNGTYTHLTLSYQVQASDLALGLPLTIAFRTVTNSVGSTYWDNARLTITPMVAPTPVPEPASYALMLTGLAIAAATRSARRRLP
jgi:hypothetical protein